MEAGSTPAGGSSEPDGAATTEIPSLGASAATGAAYPADTGHDSFAERAEVYVGAAFAGGLLLAQVLRRIGR
jgi:hypothetical protein